MYRGCRSVHCRRAAGRIDARPTIRAAQTPALAATATAAVHATAAATACIARVTAQVPRMPAQANSSSVRPSTVSCV